MNFEDYHDGTACIIIFRSDFKSEERYRQYARFMKQDERRNHVEVPIDSERARKIEERERNRRTE